MDKQAQEEQKRRKKILIFIILLLLFLSFLTSCTSSLFGTIGSWFNQEGHFEIDDQTPSFEVILNEDLIFDSDYVKVSLADQEVFLSYSLKHISSSSFTCSTSDANIATCYVKDGYVVLLPKKAGRVDVFLETIQNGKKYQAKSVLEVTSGQSKIRLSKNADQIDLAYTNRSVFSYQLEGLLGTVSVSSSNEQIATVSEKNGIVTIVAHQVGEVDIFVSLERNGVVFTATYHLTVVKSNRGPFIVDSGSMSKPGSGNDSEKPKPEKPVYSSDNRLLQLTISSGNLSFSSDVFEYSVVVSSDLEKVSFEAILRDSKAHITYLFENQVVDSLKNLPLHDGSNMLYLTVTAEDGSIQIYQVEIYRPSSVDNSLSNLMVSEGTMTPTFQPDILHYTVSVNSDVVDYQIIPVVSDSSSTISYRFQGKEVSSLNHLSLEFGKNSVEIIVSGSDGISRTYLVDVYRKDADAYLAQLEIISGSLNESFHKLKNDYSANVSYSSSAISFDLKPEASTSTVTVEWNGVEVSSLTNLSLQDGDNHLKVIVTSESGKENIYTVLVHKPVRMILFEQKKVTVDFADTPVSIFYTVLEDGKKTSDYSISDILFRCGDYDGDYDIYEDYIVLRPDYSMKDKTISLELSYQNSHDVSSVSFTMKDYYLTSYQKEYSFTPSNQYRNIVLNTNLFSGTVKVSQISGGVRISSLKNPSIYVDATSSSDILALSSLEGEVGASFVLQVLAKDLGDASIHLVASAFGEVVDRLDLQIHVLSSFEVVLDANGGFFDEFTNRYQYFLSSKDTLDLSQYQPYKIDESGNCLYYTLKEYNTKQDGSGVTYSSTTVLKDLTQDITLYAIYTEDSQYVELEETKKLYLTDVDLFHNEEYFQKYQKDSIIYPGAHGSYVMTLTNQKSEEILLKGMTLEEDTICISQKGCLNMGYIIKYAEGNDKHYTYFYGGNDYYEILNQDSLTERNQQHTKRSIPFGTNGISLKKGETIEISLLWKWVSLDDELDTDIGISQDLDYQLTVSFDFTTIEKHCKKN